MDKEECTRVQKMDKDEVRKICESMPDPTKKQFDDLDKRILEMQNKPLEYFIELFKNGKPYQDVDILKLQKMHLFSLYTNDAGELRHTAIEVWNALQQKNHEWMDVLIQLKELKKNAN